MEAGVGQDPGHLMGFPSLLTPPPAASGGLRMNRIQNLHEQGIHVTGSRVRDSLSQREAENQIGKVWWRLACGGLKHTQPLRVWGIFEENRKVPTPACLVIYAASPVPPIPESCTQVGVQVAATKSRVSSLTVTQASHGEGIPLKHI